MLGFWAVFDSPFWKIICWCWVHFGPG